MRKYDLWGVAEADIPTLYRRYRDFDLVVDSRQVSRPAHTLFFALVGERSDGHDYIPALLQLGVRHFVVRSMPDGNVPQQASIVRVTDPLAVLQQLATHHRRQFPDLPVVAITGSNGKTIVKDWLAQLLSTTYTVCATPRSYNSQIGVPLSVWQLRQEHQIAVFEAGISEAGEMERLRRIIQPTYGVLTNIGTAHLANFRSATEHLREKLLLFAEVDWLILPQDETVARDAVRNLYPHVQLTEVSTRESKSDLIESIQLRGAYLHNARLALRAAAVLGVPAGVLAEQVADLHPLSNRLEQREGRDGGPIINDSYSNDLSALAAALQFAETQNPFPDLTLILGTVQPLPQLPDRLRALIGDRVSRLLLVGPANQKLLTTLPHAAYFRDTDQLLKTLSQRSFTRQTVLIKGASYERFDRIADALSRQLHRTQLRIDLTALRHNLRLYRGLLPPHCKLLVMAKASAYGSGALPVTQLLQEAGADYLAVAYPEEGHALRRGGIHLPIMVLNAAPYALAGMVADRLEPVVHSPKQFRLAAQLGLRMHLEIDTGMGRLGFSPQEFSRNVALLRSPLVASLFTHLAASEDTAHDAFTHQQIARFDEAYRAYTAGGPDSYREPVQRHVLNSNGIARFPEATYEMVRLGIGLYGIGDAGLAQRLQPALSLTATVSSVTVRHVGESIGYGRRGVVGKDNSRIAVISIGYADGLPRAAGEGRFAVRIHGRLAPTIGAVCMDMCMIDVTGIPEVRVGDPVTVFGPEHPVELLAEAVGTIPYEILTGIGPRVHRIYEGE
ncbi:alanine racemase [Neolewinella sp.]|uniref:alanine racemase n=1 Tax=Neolewinella sp. TaxID=2993543 RepID=UPI003B5198DF